jgi:hypothetical protein
MFRYFKETNQMSTNSPISGYFFCFYGGTKQKLVIDSNFKRLESLVGDSSLLFLSQKSPKDSNLES